VSVLGEVLLSEVLSQEFLLTRPPDLSNGGGDCEFFMSVISLSNSGPSFSPKHSKFSSFSSLKSVSCLSSGEVELSPPIAESPSVIEWGDWDCLMVGE